MTKNKFYAIPSFYSFLIIVNYWGSIVTATM
jgi:hypothetical protein